MAPSDEQLKVVRQRGQFAVKACPGSGKTYTVAARYADLMRKWKMYHRGMALLSFTNVAWEEIDRKLRTEFGFIGGVQYPHFLGTLDSFLNKYIFLPFGHLEMGCNKRPLLIGPPVNDFDPIGKDGWYWGTKDLAYFDYSAFHYLSCGGIVSTKVELSGRADLVARIIEVKKKVLRAGLAIQSDATYVSLQLLDRFPLLGRIIVHRFPLMMVDEAQDTSDLHMKVIDKLIGAGLKHVMLVGDPDQAIFEFNLAHPKLFLEKHDLWSGKSLTLNGNRRSSQKICKFTAHLKLDELESQAVDEKVCNFGLEPTVNGYDKGNIKAVIESFLNLCTASGIEINPKEVAILSRSGKLLQQLFDVPTSYREFNPWKDEDHHSKCFAASRYMYSRGALLEAFRLAVRGLSKYSQPEQEQSDIETKKMWDGMGLVEFRRIILDFISKLPLTNYPLGEWVEKANSVFAATPGFETIKLSIKGGKYKNKYASLKFEELFGSKDATISKYPYYVGTVHSAKGQEYDAVLLILGTKGKGPNYTTLLGSKSLDHEELRIVYVGLTRAKRILVLCVPESDEGSWKTFFGLKA